MDNTKICKVCGKAYTPCKHDHKKSGFCSWKCYEQWKKTTCTPNCKCVICGKPIYVKPSRLKKLVHGATCSHECYLQLHHNIMCGKNNHQFGLTGDKNATFKHCITVSNYGYLLEYCPHHPYPHDRSIKGSRVLQHRLVVERNAHLFDDSFFETINGMKVLKPEYVVHHINENKQDNRIENLQVMTLGEHTSHHNKEKVINRDSKGRIIGVSKLSNIGEGCDANPEINSQIA